MMNNLVGILCRFRREPIAFIGDIERMYHRFHVAPENGDYLRFMWYKNGDLNVEPTEYRMKVFLFGVICSPACANYGLQRIAADYRTDDNSNAADFITTNFYVDDGLCSTESEEEAIKLIRDARDIYNKGNLCLHKFVSNCTPVLESIPQTEIAEQLVHDLSYKIDNVERVLGIQWCVKTDRFKFKLTLPDRPNTRRGILSIVASIYDPLGLIAPFTLRGKQILQTMCHQNMNWDDPLENDLLQRWEKWSLDLSNLENVTVARCYKPPNFGKVKSYEFHHFSDAPYSGYGQCSYIRMIHERNEIHCALVMAKARVTPRKILTIPRVELMAAVTSVKIGNILRDELRLEAQEFYWTYSQIVLAYIQNDAMRFHVFVANKIQVIQNATSRDQWRYIESSKNPADHTSRGFDAKELVTSSWLRSPEFLWRTLPKSETVLEVIHAEDVEVKRVIVHTTHTKIFKLSDRLKKFSDWNRALNSINLLRRLILRHQKKLPNSELEEMKETEKYIIKACQRAHYTDEINMMEKKELIKNKQLSTLDLFLDAENIICIGGRLKNSTLESFVFM